ncbi:hypothetical protein VTJ49DRAFT_4824 [Mycothermus thermophilus]|uniref:AMP-dependent synthetase/ligase domain-containing protein n=1 Tax=Humicola insolens TaxID=85995 RepID=A0ABR3V4G7_HUMIN
MGLASLLVALDEGVTGLFAQWNVWTSIISTTLIGFLTYQLVTRQDPDIHPFLLARQAQGSPVRYPGESSVYRSHAAPHGMPLNASLNVKEPGASKWARGRDGDLRDVWRQAVNGVLDEGPDKGATGRILTVLGTDKVVEHSLDALTRQINLIGQHLVEQGAKQVAIYLPNSVELLITLFACAFYDLDAVILPFGKPNDAVISMLRRSASDTVVTTPGAFPFDFVVRHYPSLHRVVWVVDDGNKHLDWNEVPKGTGSSVNVSTWQDVVNDSPSDAGRELPPLQDQKPPADVTVFWDSKPDQEEEMVRFTSANLISGIAAQLSAIPTAQRIGPRDLFLPADSLANTHTLVLTLAALFSNASVAFSSAAPGAEDLAAAVRAVPDLHPTILVATPAALLKTQQDAAATRKSSLFARLSHARRVRNLIRSGAMPPANPSSVVPQGSKLRLILTTERAGANTPRLSTAALADLRVLTGARVVYALTAARVAGAVAQTGLYDYRLVGEDADELEDETGKGMHFGPPVTSTEVLFRDRDGLRSGEMASMGEIIVRGPCVAGDEVALGVLGRMRKDNTITYV